LEGGISIVTIRLRNPPHSRRCGGSGRSIGSIGKRRGIRGWRSRPGKEKGLYGYLVLKDELLARQPLVATAVVAAALAAVGVVVVVAVGEVAVHVIAP
jgi:hypothetical protein